MPKKAATRITKNKSARGHVLLVLAFFPPIESTWEGVLGKIRILFLKRDLQCSVAVSASTKGQLLPR